MTDLAIIGGSGLTRLQGLQITRRQVVHTPYGEPSAPVIHGILNQREIAFLPRHGAGHTIPPHKVNYRANIWALEHIGARKILAIAAVGGIGPAMAPGVIAIPDQIIDYTYGRDHTYFEHELSKVTHIDFTYPYSEKMRQSIMRAAKSAGVPVIPNGVYGATQGPRLETAMEINRMERDGCTLVGMTGMPETALARELDLDYACCAVVANWAAGRGDGPISMKQIEQYIGQGMAQIISLIEALVDSLES
ncbi:S-methyl-5'-thioinosine phosphorylase [Sedimenticola thiotaurini]|uniref:Probable S-methyl-5'-thioinosine phosphorylase n=1 Tax=Sedimenticola thiotaurini TaxID=1543721 RepID=A0A0F7JYC1_9GAMM|nr:S-methyl-5'-thioinosine phosphorylase [Sedimenticola thiotaurini]AKH19643.1 5'-methylthioadenosine phosphorylase [Sedimenticola thiotaurini]